MMFLVKKETRLNLRITEEFRALIEELADYHGLTLSSYAHSLLVKAVRRERAERQSEVQFGAQREPNVNDINNEIAFAKGQPLAPTSQRKMKAQIFDKIEPQRKSKTG